MPRLDAGGFRRRSIDAFASLLCRLWLDAANKLMTSPTAAQSCRWLSRRYEPLTSS